MPKFVEMEAGDFAWNVAGCTLSLQEWEAYEFVKAQWVPAEEYTMFMAYPFPYLNGATFQEVMRDLSKHLPDDATVYWYNNECFGALRKK